MEKQRVLIVDDEQDICDLIEIYLSNEGLEVVKASDGIEALNVLKEMDIDLIILDVMMPKMDGIQACMQIRKDKSMPIIMLSAKGEDLDKILGLNTGADDYVTKPFNPLEIVARVRSQLRRYKVLNHPSLESKDEIQVGDLVINTAAHQVFLEDKEIRLTPTEFSILETLMRNKGRVLSTQRIYELVWSESAFECENTVAVHIRNLREKIEINPKEPRYIKVVWGVGYKVEMDN
ncbi:response regulator transcription factor [Desulfitobacterium sp.]|uniref:response regulator transcription factor n=1 Tax=Desulfitobacterium sp. TaxID=49981 RepID=UPI002B1FC820|nr:response regulator transcription factor [Desulfitobacterium sp.]MEA4900290.1 response regulator transcription factor [Desulfitobacterium sp.]